MVVTWSVCGRSVCGQYLDRPRHTDKDKDTGAEAGTRANREESRRRDKDRDSEKEQPSELLIREIVESGF